jgi:thiol-disulfide isomerase/thioredoxin
MTQRALAIIFCLSLSLSSGAEARGFVFTDSTGKKLTLSDYKGKWVLINFWATWCPPCLKEIPDLVSLYESRKDVMVIGIAMDYQNPKTVLKFVDSLSIPIPSSLVTEKLPLKSGPYRCCPPPIYSILPVNRQPIK